MKLKISPAYLHELPEFKNLLLTLEDEMGILAPLIEKDYWIMHVLYGLKNLGLKFELKGGTSLSKGFKIIDRFSEDIDIHITPPPAFHSETGVNVNENPKSTNKKHFENRLRFFEWLSNHLQVPGIIEVLRDTTFDDIPNYRSGGIRLIYKSIFDPIPGVKEGILLEAGFAKVTPYILTDISSWAYDRAAGVEIDVIDNRALSIPCYHPGYTLVEKLQTITTKFRTEQNGISAAGTKINFMRQYYDVYQLLQQKQVVDFIGSEEYKKHKSNHFSNTDLQIPISQNEAFKLNDASIRQDFRNRYKTTEALYYNGQPDFDEMITFISTFLDKLD